MFRKAKRILGLAWTLFESGKKPAVLTMPLVSYIYT